jgi:serine/threonine-protein kinase
MTSRRQSPLAVADEDSLDVLRAGELPPAESVDAFPLLGQYRILDTLGAGGMGRVYKAEHILMRRVVALKVVGALDDGLSGVAEDERHAAFLREVEAAARLSHPNVVAAFDAGEADGVRFLVMEYVDGSDLDRLVRALGPLPPRRACEYARQAAVALQYAYERGVLHRDVKPANLLLEPGDDPRGAGRVKVLDLGLARAARDGDHGADGSGRLSGTPDYIAPEVAHDAGSRDVRSDLYSLGCTVYFLLTGRVPFPGGTWTEKLLRHQYDAPVPLSELAPAVPPPVAAVVERLMAKAPADRYDTPAAVARALEEWLARGEDPPAALAPSDIGDERPRGGSTADLVVPPAPADLSARTPCPTGTLDLAPPSAWDIPAPAPVPVPPPPLVTHRPHHYSWLIVFAGAVLMGLGGAWLIRGRMAAEEVSASGVVPSPFVTDSAGTSHATLAAAVAAAADGDTITIHGDGPFVTEPLALTGKALTFRAAPGSRPALRFAGRPSAWQSLLTTDRALTLEGIALRPTAGREPAHLLYASGPSLRLVGCRVTAERMSAPIVARGVGRVELRDCDLLAGGLALCVEARAAQPCAVALSGNRIEVRDPGAAAVSVWAGERRVDPVSIDLDGNHVRGARILSLGALTTGVRVTARENRLEFGEALLCVNGFGGPDGWRRAVTWCGEQNQYGGSTDWLRVDGRPGGASGLRTWQDMGMAEGEAVVRP